MVRIKDKREKAQGKERRAKKKTKVKTRSNGVLEDWNNGRKTHGQCYMNIEPGTWNKKRKTMNTEQKESNTKH